MKVRVGTGNVGCMRGKGWELADRSVEGRQIYVQETRWKRRKARSNGLKNVLP